MFSFHKPKVYRSTQGCCICKAKSSSSRFTDSKKYEHDFIECFQLASPRKGEICNACVLLVKRFKRLPPGSERHWGHVVDARVGPGLKSMTKFKKRKSEKSAKAPEAKDVEGVGVAKVEKPPKPAKVEKSTISDNHMTRSLAFVPDKFSKIFKKNKKKKQEIIVEKAIAQTSFLLQHNNHIIDAPPSPMSTGGNSDESCDDTTTTTTVYTSTNDILIKNNEINRSFIETILSVHEGKINKNHRRKSQRPIKNYRRLSEQATSFIDTTHWNKVQTCCGYVFQSNTTNAVLIDYDLYQVCSLHKKTEKAPTNILNNKTTTLLYHNEKENKSNYSRLMEKLTLPATTAMKKHHLYSKRQNIIEHINRNEVYKTEGVASTETANVPIIFTQKNFPAPNEFNAIITQQQTVKTLPQTISPSSAAATIKSSSIHKYNNIPVANQYLHKLKSESGKIIKTTHTLDKILPAKLKGTDFNLVKNLMKICTDKSAKNKNGIINGAGGAIIIGNAGGIDKVIGNENISDALGNKFSDNSSDSGYEEAPGEQQLNLAQKLKSASAVRSVVLANGIKVHVQPQNLVRAANWAGVPQTTMASLQQQNDKTIFNPPMINSRDNIIVLQQNTGNITTTSNQNGNISVGAVAGGNITTANQNIVVMNQKYLQQTAN